MKKQILLLACLLFAATSAAGQNESAAPAATRQAELSAWQTYRIKGEEVSASFPTLPAMTTYQSYRNQTRQTLTNRMAGAYADGVVYSVYTFDNPKPRDDFEDFVAREAQMGGWDVSTGRAVKIGSYTGKEYSFQKNDLACTVQLFAVEDHFYKFTTKGVPTEEAAVKQFFSSVSFNPKEGIDVSDGPGGSFSHPTAEIVLGSQADTKARLVMKPEPSYTEEARQAATTGTVVLKVVFSSSGSVNNIRTVQGLPHGLTEQAIAAARKIKYIPAVKEGKYVSMWMQLEYNFNLY